MEFIIDGLMLFGQAPRAIQVSETTSWFESVHQYDALTLPTPEELNSWIEKTDLKRDLLCLEFKIGDREAIPITRSDISSIGQQLELINDDLSGIEKDEKIIARVSAKKNMVAKEGKNYISIFSLKAFSTQLADKTFENALSWLNDPILRVEELHFEIWHPTQAAQTSRFLFDSVYPNHKATNDLKPLLRQEIIFKRDKSAHFANAATNTFIPDDFLLNTPSTEKSLNSTFNALFIAHLFIFLCDFSCLEETTLSVRLKGYKLISEKLDLRTLREIDLSEYHEIYKWAYSDGNFTDKMGLARNLISIHLQNESLLSIETGTIHSLESGYDIYLKENVKQYIEIKNKLSEFIQSSSDKASAIATNMLSAMKTSLWAFISFFISAFIVRILGKGQSTTTLVTTDILFISYGLAAVSIILLLVARIEARSDKERFRDAYMSLKNRYKDLLTQADLERILQKDSLHEKDVSYITLKIRTYSWAWAAITAIMTLIISLLFCLGHAS